MSFWTDESKVEMVMHSPTFVVRYLCKLASTVVDGS